VGDLIDEFETRSQSPFELGLLEKDIDGNTVLSPLWDLALPGAWWVDDPVFDDTGEVVGGTQADYLLANIRIADDELKTIISGFSAIDPKTQPGNTDLENVAPNGSHHIHPPSDPEKQFATLE